MSSPQSTPSTSPSPPSTPFQSLPLDTRRQTQGNDTMSAPSLREDTSSLSPLEKDSPLPSLTPADCRTLQKILHDVRSPSPMSTAPYFDDRKRSPPFTVDNRSSNLVNPPLRRGEIPAKESKLQYFSRMNYLDDFDPFSVADEREEGYEDEDDSMELSDAEGEQDEEKDGETVEDVMNLPGKIAPPAPIQDFSAFYVHDQPTPDEIKEMRLKRAAIDRDLEEQARQQEKEVAAAVEQTDIQLSLFDGQGKELDSIHVPGFQALQEEIGMHALEDGEAVAGALESFETYDSRPSPSILSRPPTRRASEDIPFPSTSFINFPSPCAAGVVSTPGGRHIDFAPTSTVPETPFTKTLSYFKQYKGKENSPSKDSPSKRRRNASSPEEIAELAREAAVEEQEAQEEKELEGLEQYRAMDLAPEEPVMESTSAGDLIMCGTPVRTNKGWFLGSKPSSVGSPSTGSRTLETWTSSSRQADLYSSDSKIDDWVKIPATPSPQKPTLPVEQDEDHDADVEESDGDEKKQIMLYPRHPTFVTVIGMLPAAMFWAASAPVVKYGNRAFDVLVERLTGLKLLDGVVGEVDGIQRSDENCDEHSS